MKRNGIINKACYILSHSALFCMK